MEELHNDIRMHLDLDRATSTHVRYWEVSILSLFPFGYQHVNYEDNFSSFYWFVNSVFGLHLLVYIRVFPLGVNYKLPFHGSVIIYYLEL